MRIFEVESPVVYHGNQGGISNELVTPMWFTESYKDAKNYATLNNNDGWVFKAKLLCKNPYITKQGEEINSLVEQYKKLIEMGYDCIHDPSVGDWIPFYSKDIQLMDKEYIDPLDNNQ